MKLKFRYFVLIALFFPFILFSCKTTGTTKQDLTGSADAASLAVIATGREAAEEARSKAENIKGNVYCPEEWGVAEGRYKTAKAFPNPETKADTAAQTAEWKGLKTAYDDIYNKSLPSFAREQGKILAAAREEAVNAGVEDLVPDRLANADTFVESSKEKLAVNDYLGCINDANEALDRYNTLIAIAKAHDKQVEADNNNFFSEDPDNYMLAAEAGNNAVDHYDSGNLIQARKSAEESLTRFSQVIKNGWLSRLEEKEAEANRAKAAAESIKANVAVKSDYDAAQQIYNNAQRAKRTEDYGIAAELFEQSGGLYTRAYDNAVIKRDKAEKAIRVAKETLATSEQKVQTAVEIIGGE